MTPRRPQARRAPTAGPDVEAPGPGPAGADRELLEVYLGLYPKLVRSAAYLLGRSSPAEDAVQEAYVRVLSKRPTLRDPDRLGAYLRAAVVNVCRATDRRRRVADRYLTGPGRTGALAADTGIPPAEHSFARHELVVALAALPRRQREAVVLRHYAGFSEAETAAALGMPVGTVKSATSRALSNLAATLGEDR